MPRRTSHSPLALPRILPGVLAVVVAVAVGCTNPEDPSDETAAGDGAAAGEADEADAEQIVLANSREPDDFNPVAGHGANGSSRIYDGLVHLDPGDGTGIPELEPRLATSLPEPNDDATTWTVPLRDDVRFHDGSAFDAGDVVATYEAVLDPQSASPLATDFSMLDEVEKVDDHTVRFHLSHPYAAFDSLLLLGIAPADALTPAEPVEESSLNTDPIGTGPYRLANLRGDEFVLEAFDDYWAGAPPIERITVTVAADDNTRAQRTVGGEFDGAPLPPLLANSTADQPGFNVVANPTADWRGVTLPTDNPVTADPAIRLALNHAANRHAMIEAVLGGHGEPASTPVPEQFGDHHAPEATFDHDPDRARELLDDAGWEPGPDGTRIKDGQSAGFTLMYNADDTLRRDLAQAFASDAAEIGIEVDLEGSDWNEIDERMDTDAVMFGGGDRPYDPDTQLYTALHSRYAAEDAGGVYDNPSAYHNPAVDDALDEGRRSLDPATRAAAYRTVQTSYVDDPAFVTLVFLDHTYVMAQGWPEPTPILEPHTHGVNWGPWWDLQTWTL